MARVIHTAFEEYRGRLSPESGALRETPQSIAEAFADHWVAVAERGGELLGAVLYTRKGEDVYLGRLAVRPDCRRQGIGDRLLAHVETEARRLGARALTLGVRIALPENRAYFESRGFAEVGRDTHKGFDAPTSIRMAKPLRPR